MDSLLVHQRLAGLQRENFLGHDSNTVIDASQKTADYLDSANTEIDLLLYKVRGLDKAADAEMIFDDSEDDGSGSDSSSGGDSDSGGSGDETTPAETPSTDMTPGESPTAVGEPTASNGPSAAELELTLVQLGAPRLR